MNTQNPQQEAVALWKFLEARGFKPTIAGVGRILRAQTPRLRFRNEDIYAWLGPFAQTRGEPRDSSGGKRGEQIPHAGRHNDVGGESAGSSFARAVKVSLVSKPITKAKALAKTKMKQQPLDLGGATTPEIDFDRRRLDPPIDLPEDFPETTDELRALAMVFCRTFTYAKDPAKLKAHVAPYTDVLASMRKQRVSVLTAWMAFREAIIAQEGRALFGHTSKRAYAYLPNGAAARQRPPMPRLAPGENARWDEGAKRWMVGNDNDPPTARELLAARRLEADKQ